MPAAYPKILLTMPPEAVAELDEVVADLTPPHERRNRSATVRALVRRYLDEKKKPQKKIPKRA